MSVPDPARQLNSRNDVHELEEHCERTMDEKQHHEAQDAFVMAPDTVRTPH